GSGIRPGAPRYVRALAGWPLYSSPIRGSGRVQAVATDHLRFSSRESPSSRHKHLRALDVWLRCRTSDGPRHYLTLDFASLRCSSATQLAVVSMMTSTAVYPAVGASGAIFGILLAFGMLFPRRT